MVNVYLVFLFQPGSATTRALSSARELNMDVLEASQVMPLRLLIQPEGYCVELRQPSVVVGRHTEADIRLGYPDISRRHCRFLFEGGVWQITDLDSLNGLYINGERIQEAYLYDGDRLRLGGLEICVSIVDHPTIVQMPVRAAEVQVLASIVEALPMAERKAS